MSKSDAPKVILDFLIKENRPYSINDIVEKCGKEFGKSVVQKTLDALVSKSKIAEKTFGKLKIYFVKQKYNAIEHKKELQAVTQKLGQAQSQLKTKQIEWRELETKLKTLTNVRSIESLEEERDKLMEDIRNINEKLRRHEAIAAESQLTPADAKKIEKRHEYLSTSYRKRKRICNDMMDAILEGYPKSKRQLIEDIGVETDESVGFDIVVPR